MYPWLLPSVECYQRSKLAHCTPLGYPHIAISKSFIFLQPVPLPSPSLSKILEQYRIQDSYLAEVLPFSVIKSHSCYWLWVFLFFPGERLLKYFQDFWQRTLSHKIIAVCSFLKCSYLWLHDLAPCMSAQVVPVLLELCKEVIPILQYLHKQIDGIMHEKEHDGFLAYLSSLDLSATFPRTLLIGTCSELFPPWDAVGRVLGRLHWNYK